MGNKRTERKKRAKARKAAKQVKQQAVVSTARTRPRTRPQRPLRGTFEMTLRAYYHCRTNPGDGTLGDGIPDDSGGFKIVLEHKAFYDVVIGSSGGIIGRVLPSFSNPICVKDFAISPSTGATINGVSLQGTRQGINGGVGSWTSQMFGDYQSYGLTAPNTSSISFASNPFSATRARLVAQSVNFKYTGPVLSAAGTITVNPANLLLGSEEINAEAIQSYLPTSVASDAYPTGTCQTINSNLSFQNIMINGTVSNRVVEGIKILNKRIAPVSVWTDISPQPIIVTDGAEGIAAFSSIPTVQFPTTIGFDRQWQSPTFVVQGMTSGTSLRMEAVSCVEYMVEPTSVLARVTTERHSVSAAAIAKADQEINKLPIAASESFYKSMAQKLSGMLPTLAGAMGGPQARTIAELSREMLLLAL